MFCRTRKRAQRVAEGLKRANIAAECLHRDQSLAKRRALVEAFRRKEFRVRITCYAVLHIRIDDIL